MAFTYRLPNRNDVSLRTSEVGSRALSRFGVGDEQIYLVTCDARDVPCGSYVSLPEPLLPYLQTSHFVILYLRTGLRFFITRSIVMAQQLQQIETSYPGGPGEPVGLHFVKGQLLADLAETQSLPPATTDEVDVDPDYPDGGRRGD